MIFSNTATTLATPYGGGILSDGAGTFTIIRFNEIWNNTAQYGGGVSITNGGTSLVYSNTIRENTAVATTTLTTPPVQLGSTGIEGGGAVGSGGGIYTSNANAQIAFNNLTDNRVVGDSTSYIRGGGIALMDANSLIIDNTIQNNTLDGQGESRTSA
jgi:hypothetical protein